MNDHQCSLQDKGKQYEATEYYTTTNNDDNNYTYKCMKNPM